MCSISGIWHLDGAPVRCEAIDRFTRVLAHRGPDGDGAYVDARTPGLALGHRRLAILDPRPAGTQPMSSPDGRYHLTFNGEIYNFLELRATLERDGHRFRTETDSEVILAAYARWGEACQRRFNGMWAFAIWDAQERCLFLSRDRFGVKPLYYLIEPDRFAFASELKAFRALAGFTPRVNPAALRWAVAEPFALDGCEQTLLLGVARLLGGHSLTVADGGVAVRRWWNTLDHLPTPAARFEAQAEEFRALFFDACRLRLRSDVPIATCLSGGIDSSSVLCTVAAIDASDAMPANERRAPDHQHAFVAGFAATPLDERRYAEIAAARAGVRVSHVPMPAQATVEETERVIYDLDELTFTSAAPIWMLYRALRRSGVVVALNGDGADELLGGYLRHAVHALSNAGGFLRAPQRTFDLLETLHHLRAPDGPTGRSSRWELLREHEPGVRAVWQLAQYLRAVARRAPRRGRDGSAPSGSVPARPWCAPPAEEIADPRTGAAEEALAAGLSPLAALLYVDFHVGMLPAILRGFDRCSMAHGVEVRDPFLDWRLVCYAFALPDASKIGAGVTKRVLRAAMRGTVPNAILRRRAKIGFNAPLPTWFRGELGSWLWERVNDRAFLESDLWNGPVVRDFVAAKRQRGGWTWSDGESVWPFVHAHAWLERFVGDARDASSADRYRSPDRATISASSASISGSASTAGSAST